MSAKKNKTHYFRWTLLILTSLPIVFRFNFWPTVYIKLSPLATEDFHYVWNTQDRIYRGDLRNGKSTIEFGHLFPDEDFFMRFDWWTDKGFSRCIYVTPKWGPNLEIHLDAYGLIDTKKTNRENLSNIRQCDDPPDSFRR